MLSLIVLVGIGTILLLVALFASRDRIAENGCSTFLICESEKYCGTFSLGAPIIYIIKDNPVKEYYAILHTFHVNKEEFERMQCYDNEEIAQAAGYQPSEKAKRGIAAFERLNKSPEERGVDQNSATNTIELLQDIDAVIGL